MTTPPASPLFWRQLISLLKDRQVIPVVGNDAIVVEDAHGPCTLNTFVARRVEATLELPRTAPPEPVTLHQVACRYLEGIKPGDGRQIGDLYWAVKEALAEPPAPEPPPALCKLAGIDAFTLYVTTTFDDLLKTALDRARHGGRPRTRSFAYSPEDVQDLPSPMSGLDGPAVYHLLGRVSAISDYVVTEEDTLEWVHSLQSENRRPTLLLDDLRSHSLLLIGSGYSDWLMRFFLRIGNRERLLLARSKSDILVDAKARDDTSLAGFLRYFGGQTRVFTGNAAEFVDELAARWDEARPVDRPGPATPSEAAPPRTPGEHPIFISYASEDRDAAMALHDALRAANLPVWLDRGGGLQGGVDYEREIEARIRGASLFAPLLSRNVLTPGRRFFRLEWNEALDEAKRAAANQAFIVPICLDDVPPDAEQIPPRLRQLHWLRPDGGSDFGPAVQRLRELYREFQLTLSPAP
jgi:hypothetical protein